MNSFNSPRHRSANLRMPATLPSPHTLSPSPPPPTPTIAVASTARVARCIARDRRAKPDRKRNYVGSIDAPGSHHRDLFTPRRISRGERVPARHTASEIYPRPLSRKGCLSSTPSRRRAPTNAQPRARPRVSSRRINTPSSTD